jgi:hypothetical protein
MRIQSAISRAVSSLFGCDVRLAARRVNQDDVKFHIRCHRIDDGILHCLGLVRTIDFCLIA